MLSTVPGTKVGMMLVPETTRMKRLMPVTELLDETSLKNNFIRKIASRLDKGVIIH